MTDGCKPSGSRVRALLRLNQNKPSLPETKQLMTIQTKQIEIESDSVSVRKWRICLAVSGQSRNEASSEDLTTRTLSESQPG